MIKQQGFWRWLYEDGFLWLNRIHPLHPSKTDLIGVGGIVLAFGGLVGFLVAAIIFNAIWYILGPLAPISNILGYVLVSYAVYLENRRKQT